VINPGVCKVPYDPLDEWYPFERDQRFRQVVGKRPEPGTQARCKYHCFHGLFRITQSLNGLQTQSFFFTLVLHFLHS
jgi:hypothetical protein